MAQQPNIEIAAEDRPRPVPEPGPPRRWKADRPGDLSSPGEVPWGGAFGTPGPDTGFAARILRKAIYELAPGESAAAVETALVAVISARASLFGRAPTRGDAASALLILGLGGDLPPEHADRLAADRMAWVPTAGRSAAAARAMVGTIPHNDLQESPEALQERLAAGHRPLAA